MRIAIVLIYRNIISKLEAPNIGYYTEMFLSAVYEKANRW